jgi:hypothetical protein
MPLPGVTVSEPAFYKQAALVREALLNFSIISQLNAPRAIRPAMEDLIDITVRSIIILLHRPDKRNIYIQVAFDCFVPFYHSMPFLQELPASALSAINAFIVKHKSFTLPENFPRLVGLVSKIDALRAIPAEPGESFHS